MEKCPCGLQMSPLAIKLDVPAFINRVKKDTSFYKAFKNLRILQFTSLNSIQILNKQGKPQATLQSKTR